MGHQLRALDAMNGSRLWMTLATLSHELKARDAMNRSGLWMTSTTLDLNNKYLKKKSKRVGRKYLGALRWIS